MKITEKKRSVIPQVLFPAQKEKVDQRMFSSSPDLKLPRSSSHMSDIDSSRPWFMFSKCCSSISSAALTQIIAKQPGKDMKPSLGKDNSRFMEAKNHPSIIVHLLEMESQQQVNAE